jgi:hypothetical protein
MMMVLGVNTASAMSIAYTDYHYNIIKRDFEFIEDKIIEAGLIPFNENLWSPSQIETEGDDKSFTFEFDNPIHWLVTKWGRDSQLVYVGGLSNFMLTSPNGKALSYYAAVPEPDTLLFLSTILLLLVSITRNRYIKPT